MIIHDMEQGSEEWHKVRCGVPTSSNFSNIVTTLGIRSKSKEKYLYKIAGEKVIGKAEETYKNAAMERGTLMEPEARKLYEFVTGNKVEEVGFCITEGAFKYGASPDGVVGEDGLLEIKCPLVETHVSYLLKGTLPSAYFQQVQGQMLVTGRKWVDFMSYFPGLKPLIIRVNRDEGFLTRLKAELQTLCLEINDVVTKIQ